VITQMNQSVSQTSHSYKLSQTHFGNKYVYSYFIALINPMIKIQLLFLRILKSVLLLLVLATSSSHVFSQEATIDDFTSIITQNIGDTTHVSALNSLFWLERKSNPERAIKYLDRAIKLAKKLNYKKGIAVSYRYYGNYYNSRGDYDQALVVLNKSKVIFTEIGYKKGIILCLNGLGNTSMNQGNSDGALAYYLKTAELNKEMNNLRGVAKAQHNIGNVHYRIGQYEKALEYFELSLKLKETIADSSGMVITLNAISVVYTTEENYSESLKVQLSTLEIAYRVSDLHEIANLLNNIGVQYFYLEKLDSTRYYYLKALNIYNELDEKQEIAGTYSNLGGLECLLENGRQASYYFDSSLIIAREIGDHFFIAKSYEGLAESNRLLGNHEVAYDWFVKFHFLTDSLTGERVKENINELQLKYESGKKDLQIVELENGEAEAIAVADKRKHFLILGGIVVIALVILFILYSGRRRAREKLRITELEQKALRAQMNPHFIFNSLNSIQRLYIEGKEDLANDYMADFSNLLRRILENSSMDRVSLKEELSSTSLYLDLEKMRTDNVFDYQIVVDPTIDQLNSFVPPLILQPFVENSIWHGIVPKGEQGLITIQIKKSGESDLECILADNGIGIAESMNQKSSTSRESKGMSITADRLGGDNYVVASELATGGTEIKLRIKKIR